MTSASATNATAPTIEKLLGWKPATFVDNPPSQREPREPDMRAQRLLLLLVCLAVSVACARNGSPSTPNPSAQAPEAPKSPTLDEPEQQEPPPRADAGVARTSGKFRKLAESDVDTDGKAKSAALATRLLTGWPKDSFKPFGDEATEAVRTQLTPDLQRQTWEAAVGAFGDYISYEYVEAWMPTDAPLLRIYRYRVKFSSGSDAEFRIVLDGRGRLAGLFLKPWNAELR